jgi:hypothetical protein
MARPKPRTKPEVAEARTGDDTPNPVWFKPSCSASC